MVRAPCFDQYGMKKGAWSEDEDNKLRDYIERYGHPNWRELPKFAGLSRCGKSCRLRWMNYLRPNVKRGNFTKEEEEVILGLHTKLGNKWSTIAAKLPGRSDNEIKNHWHSHLKTRPAQKDRTLSRNELQVGCLEADKACPKGGPLKNSNIKPQEEVGILLAVLSSDLPSSSSRTESSCSLSGSDCAVSSHVAPQPSDYVAAEDFWAEPFLPDNDGSIYSSDTLSSPLGLVNNFISEASCQDMLMADEFLWSTLDLYF